MEIGIDVNFTIDRRRQQVLFRHELRELSVARGKVKPVPSMLQRHTLKRFCALKVKFSIILLGHIADRQGYLKRENFTNVTRKTKVVPVHRAGNTNIISDRFL